MGLYRPTIEGRRLTIAEVHARDVVKWLRWHKTNPQSSRATPDKVYLDIVNRTLELVLAEQVLTMARIKKAG